MDTIIMIIASILFLACMVLAVLCFKTIVFGKKPREMTFDDRRAIEDSIERYVKRIRSESRKIFGDERDW